jgi:hypothetical protein
MKKGIFFALLIIAVVGGVYFASTYAVRTLRSNVAQWRGDAFVQKLYAEYTILGKSCQSEDTDGDSYVSCDFRIKNPQSEEKVIHLQCPGIRKTLLGNSCKESRLVIPQ